MTDEEDARAAALSPEDVDRITDLFIRAGEAYAACARFDYPDAFRIMGAEWPTGDALDRKQTT